MHKNISITLPTRNRPEYITQFVNSYISTTKNLEDKIPALNIIYHNPTKPSRHKALNSESFPILETTITEDCGLTTLFNMGIILSPTDWVFIAQDDITFNNGWVDYLEEKISEGNHEIVHLFHYGAMLFHKSLILKVGWFDENFRGGGFEDIDYQLRISEAGLRDRVDRSHDFIRRDGNIEVGHYCNHHKYENKNPGSGWEGRNNATYMCEKWGRSSAYNYRIPSFRCQPEIDWHPLFTKIYEERYEMKSLYRDIYIESINKRELYL